MDARRVFEEVCWAHEPAVRAFVMRRMGVEGADDVVSDVFLAAWRRFDQSPGDPLPWLLSIARGVLSNRRRAEGRGRSLVERLACERRVAGIESAGDVDLRVFEALASLSEADRELLLLIAWDRLSREQIAAVLGTPRGTVAVRVHRARRRFARAFDSLAAAEGRVGQPSSLEVS